jgi:hypothetical protein
VLPPVEYKKRGSAEMGGKAGPVYGTRATVRVAIGNPRCLSGLSRRVLGTSGASTLW